MRSGRGSICSWRCSRPSSSPAWSSPGRNWREDPAQRTGRHLALWFLRVLVGGMWFQGMLWKLPLPVSPGLQYWLEQMGHRAAFAFHRQLATDFYVPYLHILDPFVFLAELTFAVSLILGLRRSPGRQPGGRFRAASLARHLSAGRSGRVAVVLRVPRDRHADVCDRCRRSQPRSRCLASPPRAGGAGWNRIRRQAPQHRGLNANAGPDGAASAAPRRVGSTRTDRPALPAISLVKSSI